MERRRTMKTGLMWGAIVAGMIAGGPVSAGEAVKVGVVQQQLIIEKTKEGKRALETLKEFQASRQRIISADDADLKKLEDEVKSQEGGLSEAEKAKKQEQFRVKFEAYQRRIQDFNNEIQQRQQAITEQFRKKIDEAMQVVAEKGGFIAVLDEGGVSTIQVVLYAHPSIDLTEQVIKEFDRRNK